MIVIHKGMEPDGLAALREKARLAGDTPEEAYERLQNPLKRIVRKALVREQGGLCAYCMCKIPPVQKEHVEELYIHLEHIIPRNPEDGRDVGQGLDYNNLVATCRGYVNDEKVSGKAQERLTCDAHKDNQEFKKINPLCEDTLESIYYTLDGKILSDDVAVNKDLNEILNLNSPYSPLVSEREAALRSLIQELQAEDSSAEIWQSYLDAYLAETEKKTPYVGILIWYLRSLLESNCLQS